MRYKNAKKTLRVYENVLPPYLQTVLPNGNEKEQPFFRKSQRDNKFCDMWQCDNEFWEVW